MWFSLTENGWNKFQVNKAAKASGEMFSPFTWWQAAKWEGKGWSTLSPYNNVAAMFRTNTLFHVLVLWLYYIRYNGALTAYLCKSLLFLGCFIYCVCSCMSSRSGALCCNAAETWINTYELQCSCSNGKLLQYCACSEMYLVHTEMMDTKPPLMGGFCVNVF